jgi:hypothetical protein
MVNLGLNQKYCYPATAGSIAVNPDPDWAHYHEVTGRRVCDRIVTDLEQRRI